MSIGSEYLQGVIKLVNYYKVLGDKTFAQLEEFEFHFQPNAGSNSIALIIQHMAGNMLSRWTDFLDLDGEKDWRNRDTEFEEQQLSGNQLIALWEKGWACFTGALSGLTENDLLKTIYIRQEALLVVDAINRQLAHYPYHVGQIIYTAKIIKDKQWTNLSIPRGGSAQFNDQLKKQ